MSRSLGQVAYDAYGDHVCWRTFRGDVMPQYADSPQRIRAAWEAGAVAVVREVTVSAPNRGSSGVFMGHEALGAMSRALTSTADRAEAAEHDAKLMKDAYARAVACIQARHHLPWWRIGVFLRRPWRRRMVWSPSWRWILHDLWAWLFICHDCSDPAVACSCTGSYRHPSEVA